MKTLSKIFIALVLLGTFGLMKPQQAAAQGVGVSFQLFYDQLSPYGQWVEYPGYNYVWIPDAGPDFSPYATAGHWVFTNFGWTWVSDYPWGWAPFHYGRWFFDDYYGWMWVPGRVWGPAWVQWRRCEGYYGWAPISPGISIEMTFGRDYYIRHDHWRFVRDRDFDRDDIDRYYVNRRDNDRYVDNSTVITNRTNNDRGQAYYIAGPERTDVQKYTGREVRAYPIKENTNPGQAIRDNQLVIYKPVIQKTKGNSPSPVPQKAVPIKEAKSWTQRTGQNTPPGSTPNENNMGKVQPGNQHTSTPPVKQEQNVRTHTATPNDNMGKVQPGRQNNATPPNNEVQKVKSQNATPEHNNTGKTQQVQHQGGKPVVSPQQVKHPQGQVPVNTKKAEPVKKAENAPKK